MSCLDWEAYDLALGPTLSGVRFDKKVSALAKKAVCLEVIDALSKWYQRPLRKSTARGKSGVNLGKGLCRMLQSGFSNVWQITMLVALQEWVC